MRGVEINLSNEFHFPNESVKLFAYVWHIWNHIAAQLDFRVYWVLCLLNV